VPYSAAPAADGCVPPGGIDALDLPEGGFGLALTLAAVDDLRYTRDTGIDYWRIMKKL
jgi:hypothetical protein